MGHPELPQVKLDADKTPVINSQVLLTGGVVACTAAAGVFFLTHFTFVAWILALVGAGFLISRQLVRKSLELTAAPAHQTLTSSVAQLAEMQRQVSKTKFLEYVEKEGEKAAQQAEQLVEQHKNLLRLLQQKFEPGEITHARYADAVESACFSIGENLMHAKRILENLSLTKPSKTNAGWNAGLLEVLKTNDEALAALTTLYSEINVITTKEKHRDQLEQTMQQVKELAARAKQYSKN